MPHLQFSHSGPVYSASHNQSPRHLQKQTLLQQWGAPHPECRSPLCLTRPHSSWGSTVAMVGGGNPNIAAMRWPPGMGSWGLQWPCRPAGLWWATPSGDLPRLCWLFPYLPMNYLLNNQEEILSAPDGQDTRVCSFFFSREGAARSGMLVTGRKPNPCHQGSNNPTSLA